MLAMALLAGLLLPAMPLPLAPGSARAQSAPVAPALQERRAKIDQLGSERSQAEQSLARIEASEGELRREIDKLSDVVRESHRRKEGLEERIRLQQAEAEEQRREARRLEDEIRASRERIGQRLGRLYRVAKQGHSAVLFQMARFRSFAKDTRSLALLQEADRAAIARFEALGRELAIRQRQVEQSVQRLLSLRDELDEETHQLSDREAYLRAAMANVARNRTLYQRYLADVEKMMERMESAVAKLEAEARAAPPPPRLRSPAELRGTLPVPTQGEVIAPFGAQDPRYDLKKRQRGILLRVAPKAAIAAVAPGRAVHAGPFRGYQALVVLDHGEGLFTVYGHLEDLKVKRGDWVPQGTVIGQATYQPVDEAYDLYFEVRHNGRPDDPLTWVVPGQLRVAKTAPASGEG